MKRLTRFVVKISLLLFVWLVCGSTFFLLIELLKTSVSGGPWGWPVAYIGCVFVVLAIVAELIPDMDNN
jgi:hypothetical protein